MIGCPCPERRFGSFPLKMRASLSEACVVNGAPHSTPLHYIRRPLRTASLRTTSLHVTPLHCSCSSMARWPRPAIHSARPSLSPHLPSFRIAPKTSTTCLVETLTTTHAAPPSGLRHFQLTFFWSTHASLSTMAGLSRSSSCWLAIYSSFPSTNFSFSSLCSAGTLFLLDDTLGFLLVCCNPSSRVSSVIYRPSCSVSSNNVFSTPQSSTTPSVAPPALGGIRQIGEKSFGHVNYSDGQAANHPIPLALHSHEARYHTRVTPIPPAYLPHAHPIPAKFPFGIFIPSATSSPWRGL